jgi:hypothetical protein
MTLFRNALRPLMQDTVSAQPGNFNGYGTFVPSGAVIAVRCRCKNGEEKVAGKDGKETVSTVHFVTDKVYGLTVDMEYTLPSDFTVSSPFPVAVGRPRDEQGPHHEKVYFR